MQFFFPLSTRGRLWFKLCIDIYGRNYLDFFFFSWQIAWFHPFSCQSSTVLISLCSLTAWTLCCAYCSVSSFSSRGRSLLEINSFFFIPFVTLQSVCSFLFCSFPLSCSASNTHRRCFSNLYDTGTDSHPLMWSRLLASVRYGNLKKKKKHKENKRQWISLSCRKFKEELIQVLSPSDVDTTYYANPHAQVVISSPRRDLRRRKKNREPGSILFWYFENLFFFWFSFSFSFFCFCLSDVRKGRNGLSFCTLLEKKIYLTFISVWVTYTLA